MTPEAGDAGAGVSACGGRGLPPGPGGPALVQCLRFLHDPYGFLAEQQARFGDAFTPRLSGWGDFVLVSAPDDIRKVFTAPPEVLSAGRARRVLDLIYGTRSLLTRDDPEHARQRRQLMPLFHRDQLVRGGRPALDATRTAMAAWPADRPFRLTPHLLSLTTEVLTRLLLDLEQEEARRFERHLHRFIDAAHHPAVFNLPPALTRYGAGPWRRYRRTKADLDGHVDRMIAARRARSPAPAPVSAQAHLPRLRYLTAAVTEAVRLYSINPVVPRRVLRPGFTVAGHLLPVGTYRRRQRLRRAAPGGLVPGTRPVPARTLAGGPARPLRMDALRRRRPQVHGRLVRHARRPGGHARVRDEIKRLLASRLRLSAGALDEQATLESLGLDSLPLAETMVALQDQYDVHPDLVLLGDRLTPTRPLAALVDELTRSVRTP